MSAAVLALLGTLFGGTGLKAIEWIVGRRARKLDVAAQWRGELRKENVSLRRENDKLRLELDKSEAEVDLWRTKYYSLVSTVARQDLAGQRIIIEGK